MPKRSFFHPPETNGIASNNLNTNNDTTASSARKGHKRWIVICCLIFLGLFLVVLGMEDVHENMGLDLEEVKKNVVEMTRKNFKSGSGLSIGVQVGSQSASATPENAPQTEGSTSATTPTEAEDSCSLLRPASSLESLRDQLKHNWISYNETPTETQDYFLQVHQCAENFAKDDLGNLHYVGLDPSTFVLNDPPLFSSGPRLLEAFQCTSSSNSHPSTTITQQTIQDLVSQSSNILFAGDSVLKQQYLLFICMLNPQVQANKEFTIYEKQRYQYDYNTTISTATTSIRFEAIGRVWDPKMYELWHGAFVHAIASFGPQDLIIMDSSRHFNTPNIQEFHTVLTFIQSQAAQANASIYYMEPTPQEWPTSNGFPFSPCYWKCQCQMLTEKSLIGRALPLDPAAQVNLTSNETLDKRTNVTLLQTNLYDPYFKLFGHDQASPFTTLAKQDDLSCIPDCVPATWRVDLVRSMLATTTNKKLHLVPLFWQLVGRSQHSSVLGKGDCTHRSIDAVFFMNQQLIRSVSQHQRGNNDR